MKKFNRLLALILATVMILSCLPVSIFAADSELSFGSEMDNDPTLQAYKVYEGTINESTYLKGDVKYTVYLDRDKATEQLDAVFYVINWNDEGVGRIGKDSDIDIVTDLINSEISEQTGNGTIVIVLDYGKNKLAKAPLLKNSLSNACNEFRGKSVKIWADESHTDTTTVSVNSVYENVLAAGYRLAKNIKFFELDVHGSLGTLQDMIESWNENIAPKKYIYYAYHTGDDSCTYDHESYDVECIAGAPQEIDGVVVEHAKQKAPSVSRPEDCRTPYGDVLDYALRLDIAYPSGEDVEATPVYVKVGSTDSRSISSVINAKSCDQDKHVDCDATWSYERGDLMDMMFSGCTVAIFDHEYHAFSRAENFGHVSANYSSYMNNSAKVGRAAIRCIRYYADDYGYNADLIGIGGISKGSPAAGVLAIKDNKYVIESKAYTCTINGESVTNNDIYFEGDEKVFEDGTLVEVKTGTKQPFMTYEGGYDNNLDNEGTEISSEVTVAYSAAGFGPRWISGHTASTDMKLGTTNPITGNIVETVPMIHSAGYHDGIDAWAYWDRLINLYNDKATEPYLMIAMEDQGHSIPNGIDPIRDYDRADAYRLFMLSCLMPDKFENSVAYVTPKNNSIDVELGESVQVQLIRPAESLDTFVSAASVKDENGASVNGIWSTDKQNLSGLYTFTPAQGFDEKTQYTVTVDDSIVSTGVTKTFTTSVSTECLADTYVSANEPDKAFGKSPTLLLNGGITVGDKRYNENIIFVSFGSSILKGVDGIMLNVPALNDAGVNAEILVIDDYCIDESNLTWNQMIDEGLLDRAVSLGDYTLTGGRNNLYIDTLKDEVEGKRFTLVIRATDEVTYSFYEDFESFTPGNATESVPIDGDSTYGDASKESAVIVPHTKEENSLTYWCGHKDTENVKSLGAFDLAASGNRRLHFRDTNGGYRNVQFGFDPGLSNFRVYNSISNAEITVDENNQVWTNGINITGRTYRFSTEARTNNTSAKTVTLYAGASKGDDKYGNSVQFSTPADSTIYSNVNYIDYTVSPEHVKAEVIEDDTLVGYSYPVFQVKVSSFAYLGFFKTIEVKDGKELQVELRSKECEEPESTLSVMPLQANTVIADTYVTSSAPYEIFGLNDGIVLDGGDVAFITYVAGNKNDNLTLTLPAASASTDVKVLVFDNYIVDEATLSYSSMPDLDSAREIGEFTLSEDSATEIELGKLTSPIFTVAIKSLSQPSGPRVIYSQDLESVSLGNLTNTYNDATIGGQKYTYSYIADGADPNGLGNILIINGNVSGTRTVEADPKDSSNKVIKLLTYKKSGVGNIKFQNSMGTSVLPNADLPAGTKLEFSFRIMLTDEKISADGRVSYPRKGNGGQSSNAKIVKVDSSKVGEWQDITVTYTVPETPETLEVNGYLCSPAFAIQIKDSDTAAEYAFYLDDFKTTVLSSATDSSKLSFGSRESDDGAYDFNVKIPLDGNTVAIEATVDNTASGDVISIVDGETYSLLKAVDGKLMFGDIVLCNDKGEEIVLSEEATKVVAIYDDNTGTVRFAVGNFLAYYKDGDTVKATFALPAINGGVSENAKIIGADSVNVIKATSEIIGPQVHTDDLAVRFIAGVDAIYYTKVGFKIETATNAEVKTSNIVYASVKENGNDVLASAYGYNYISALSLTDIDKDGKIKVTPFLRVGDNDILGTSVYYDIVLKDGVLSISEITENEFGA